MLKKYINKDKTIILSPLQSGCVLVTQSCLILCNPMDCRPPGSSVWIGLPFLSLEDLPNPGIRPVSPALASEFFTPEPPGKPVLRIKQL